MITTSTHVQITHAIVGEGFWQQTISGNMCGHSGHWKKLGRWQLNSQLTLLTKGMSDLLKQKKRFHFLTYFFMPLLVICLVKSVNSIYNFLKSENYLTANEKVPFSGFRTK